MTKLLRDIYILKMDGCVMFKRVFKETMDAQLFGGFMSALESFASHVEEGGLSSFDLGMRTFIVIKHDDMYFVANFDRSVKKKKAEQELKLIMQKFLSTYTVELVAGWDGNIATFESFEEEIADSLEEVIDTFEKAFW
ncbi:MAG: hypothetical protein ACTSUE_10680 [Promethearchaeota archaeon]